jgi:hypothetical protein
MLGHPRMPATLAGKLAAGGISAALVLGVGTAAGAAVGAGPFEHDTSSAPTPGAPVTHVEGNQTETQQFVNIPDGTTQTFSVGAAGTVTVMRQGNTLTITSVNPAAGFTIVRQHGEKGELNLRLTNGTVTVRFDAQLDDGVVRIRVRMRGVDEPPTTVESTTPTTAAETENELPEVENENQAPEVENDRQNENEHENQAPEMDHSGSGDQQGGMPATSPSGGDGSGDSGHDGGTSGDGGSSAGGS